MKTLYAHQAKFLKKNPDRMLLLWETGTGKTLAACEWIKKRKDRYTLVICPKAIKSKWLRDLEEAGVDELRVLVLTRDEVKKHNIEMCDALVIDEAQDFASPLFSKARSDRATKIYDHVKKYPDTHVLLLTATPVRSTPWNAHTLACYLQILWPVKEFRSQFEYMTDRYGRMHYELVSGWRKGIRPYIESISDIVLLSECADVPTQHEQVITIPWSKDQEREVTSQYMEPAKEWHTRHRRENGPEKLAKLKELVGGYRKVIVVCYYTEQIATYSKELGRDRQVFVLQGATKNQDEVIQSAQESDDCIFFVQASMGAGFDADKFSVMIFASQSFKFTDEIQTRGRILRRHNLHENTYIYLLGGECDQGVFDVIQKGHDFHPPSYLQK